MRLAAMATNKHSSWANIHGCITGDRDQLSRSFCILIGKAFIHIIINAITGKRTKRTN